MVATLAIKTIFGKAIFTVTIRELMLTHLLILANIIGYLTDQNQLMYLQVKQT